jgi:hypothetical protein
MKAHPFGARPVHSLMKDHPQLCGHVGDGVVCGQERDHPDHIEPDAFATLERRMAGAPRA